MKSTTLKPPRRTTPQARLSRIVASLAKLAEQERASVGATAHIGGGRTTLTPCDPSKRCPRCAREQQFAKWTHWLIRLRRGVEREIAETSSKGLSKARAARRGKISIAKYNSANAKQRSRKELASLLGVTLPGLRKWEKANLK